MSLHSKFDFISQDSELEEQGMHNSNLSNNMSNLALDNPMSLLLNLFTPTLSPGCTLCDKECSLYM